MYAIVEIAGQQFKVEEGKKIYVHRLDAKEGQEIDFDKVLLIENENKITIGEPTIKDAIIEGKVLDHMKGDKVIVFKKKRRKGYRVKNGHRQNFSLVEIVRINEQASTKKVNKAKETAKAADSKISEEPVAEKKSTAKTSAVKKGDTPVKKTTETKATVKKPSEEKTAAKKTAVKKPAVKKPATKKPATKKPAAKKPAQGKE